MPGPARRRSRAGPAQIESSLVRPGPVPSRRRTGADGRSCCCVLVGRARRNRVRSISTRLDDQAGHRCERVDGQAEPARLTATLLETQQVPTAQLQQGVGRRARSQPELRGYPPGRCRRHQHIQLTGGVQRHLLKHCPDRGRQLLPQLPARRRQHDTARRRVRPLHGHRRCPRRHRSSLEAAQCPGTPGGRCGGCAASDPASLPGAPWRHRSRATCG